MFRPGYIHHQPFLLLFHHVNQAGELTTRSQHARPPRSLEQALASNALLTNVPRSLSTFVWKRIGACVGEWEVERLGKRTSFAGVRHFGVEEAGDVAADEGAGRAAVDAFGEGRGGEGESEGGQGEEQEGEEVVVVHGCW